MSAVAFRQYTPRAFKRLRFHSGSVFRLRLNDMASVFFVWSVPYYDCTMETERKPFIDRYCMSLDAIRLYTPINMCY